MRIEQKKTGFTLVEVLAALALMAVLIPVVVSALRVASLSGEVAKGKDAAARIADRVLNETVVTMPSGSIPFNGIVVENARSYRWTLQQRRWPVMLTSTSALQVVSVNVSFAAQGRSYDVGLSTLVEETR